MTNPRKPLLARFAPNRRLEILPAVHHILHDCADARLARKP